jgi:hypothetical protein
MKETKKGNVEKMKEFVNKNKIDTIKNIKYSRKEKSYYILYNDIDLYYSDVNLAWDLINKAM